MSDTTFDMQFKDEKNSRENKRNRTKLGLSRKLSWMK